MRILLFTFFIGISTLNAQQIDYNSKNGFIAKGFDVVAYFNNQAIEGNNKITTIYDGVGYKFYTQKNLNIFAENPKKYVPQYGGYCAYAIAVNSKKVSINPQTFEIRDGKLYLFYNAWGTNTLELWNKEDDVKVFQKKADKNWEAIKLK